MKKTIVAILIIAIAAFSCFAKASITTDNDVVLLKGKVAGINSIVYTLQAKKSGAENNYASADIVDLDLSKDGIVNVRVIETSTYNKKDEIAHSLKVTVTDFINGYAPSVTLVVTLDNPSGASDASGGNIDYSAVSIDKIDNNKVATWTCTYAGLKYISVSGQETGHFNINWDGADLAAGNYTSTITLEVDAQ